MELYKRYMKAIKPYRSYILVAVIWMVIAQVFALVQPYALKAAFDLIELWNGKTNISAVLNLIEEVMSSQGLGKLGTTLGVLLIVFFFQIASSVIQAKANLTSIKLFLQQKKGVSALSFERVVRFSIGYHIREETGRLIERIDAGVEAIRRVTETIFLKLLQHIVKIPLLLAMAIYFDWRVGLLMMSGLPILIWLVYQSNNRNRLKRKDRESSAEDVKAVRLEALSNIMTIQVYNREASTKNLYSDLLEKNRTSTYVIDRIFVVLGQYQRILGSALEVGVIGLAIYSLVLGESSIGTCVLLLIVNGQLQNSVDSTVWYFMNLTDEQERLQRFFTLLDRRPEIESPDNPLPIDKMHGAITFEKVDFTYPESQAGVKEVDLAIRAGETLAIIGDSGAGKSTLIHLLLRHSDVHAGRILVDGKDLREIDQKKFLSQIGLVSRRAGLISSLTVAENIAYGRPTASRTEIIEAARQANAHEFIIELEQGYDTLVHQRGHNLSDGQVQRLAIARAILRDPRILILDEATSELDTLSELKIKEALKNITKGRTTIIIAHRFSTIGDADRILIMKKGRIDDLGTREALYERNPSFRLAADIQSFSS